MARTLYLMRHGLTFFNVLDLIQGWCDSPLVETGVEQARLAAEWLKERGARFTHAYASPSTRAIDTCALATGMTPVCERGLREIFFGTLEGSPCYLSRALEPDQMHRVGGENFDEAEKRICDTLATIMARPGHESVFVVAHGRVNQLFRDHWSSDGSYELDSIPPNGSILIFEYDEESRTFSQVNAYLPEVTQFISNPLARIGYLY